MIEKTLPQYLQLAQSQQQQGNLAAAITTYRQTIQAFPQNYQPYNHLGKALVEQGDLDAAIAILHRGIELESNISWLYYHLATALRKQGNLSAAMLNYQKGININPKLSLFYEKINFLKAKLDSGDLDPNFAVKTPFRENNAADQATAKIQVLQTQAK